MVQLDDGPVLGRDPCRDDRVVGRAGHSGQCAPEVRQIGRAKATGRRQTVEAAAVRTAGPVVGRVRPQGRAAEELRIDRLRRGRSALGLPRPVSPSRALAALASLRDGRERLPLTASLARRGETPYGGGVERPAARGAGPTGQQHPGGQHEHRHHVEQR